MTDSDNTLIITGDANDSVVDSSGGWSFGGSSGGYSTFTKVDGGDTVTLKIDENISNVDLVGLT